MPSLSDSKKFEIKASTPIHLHARGLKVARECYCLMENGYADGALARWRTLFEICVISSFIFKKDKLIAERYLATSDVMSSKRIDNIVEVYGNHNEYSFTKAEQDAAKERRKLAEELFGGELEKDFGWAAPAILTKSGLPNTKPNLYHLTTALGMEKWVPKYKWANQEVHGGFADPRSSPSGSESLKPTL